MKTIIVHGIRTKEGMANVGRMRPFVQRTGAECVLFDYGFLNFWEARWKNNELARRLSLLVTPGDAVIGHSNGCTIIHHAATVYKAKFGAVALINPALDSAKSFVADHVDVYYNFDDKAVWISKLLFLHPWGDMGRIGAEGAWANNIDCGKTNGLPVVSGHCDIFTNRCLPQWGKFIAQRLQESSTCASVAAA